MASSSTATSIHALLDRNAAAHPQRLAVAGPNERLTWRELQQRSDAIAVSLQAHSLAPGARVCLYLPSSPDWVAAFLATRRLGLTAVSIGNRARPAELRGLISRFHVSLIATDAASAPGCVDAGAPVLDIASVSPATVVPADNEDALIHLTSGSSGNPKGVLRTEARRGPQRRPRPRSPPGRRRPLRHARLSQLRFRPAAGLPLQRHALPAHGPPQPRHPPRPRPS
jgi:acyl-CoA synthetase (AMP-forming)/AMP-acid ligase II